jgi:branched-chain amino acid transport system permease protein
MNATATAHDVTNGQRLRVAMPFILLTAILALLPFTGAYPVFVMKVLCFALFASGFNLLLGFTGLLSFGHAAFFGAAAYGAGYALKVWGAPTLIGLGFGVLSAALLGALVGWLAIRRSGIYFSMITLALAQMFYFFCLQAPFTGGEDGLQSVPRGSIFGIDLKSDLALYYFVSVVFVLAMLLFHRIVHSPFGQVLKAIRENEPRAVSLGYSVERFKLLAFILSAAIAGLAGALKCQLLGFATLSDVLWTTSGVVILMTLLGGIGTTFGPLIGALIIVALENKVGEAGVWLGSVTGIEWFKSLGESVTVVTGLVFVVCVLLFRKGLVGEFNRLRQGRLRRQSAATAAATAR